MKKLSNTKTLTLAAMLTAIGIVLGYFKFPINQFIEIRFAFVPLCLAGLLLGPGIAGVMGILVDVGGFLMYPTGPFFPGFTFSSMMTGVIFGLFLYKKRVTLQRMIVTMVTYTMVVGVLLNSIWLNMLYLKLGYFNTILYRLPKEAIMLVVNTAIIYTLLKAFESVKLYEKI
ncbi:ECF transporter S component, folate family [Pseudobutyrivibrio sp. AR14]|uniref:folate family ECF transporter S component n=1 Tax=Pseudobutyrivibrio sp. AR14 TaxID=1520804 RepID=UPI0008862563|nr:folate family ECF transporter S component [Pseudobutyrivibrio sp. AR14]SCX92391.1 ECF transporter S component, folate family [Pseudobutyrivibrio sp. AR14]